jgi:hypothetical protein
MPRFIQICFLEVLLRKSFKFFGTPVNTYTDQVTSFLLFMGCEGRAVLSTGILHGYKRLRFIPLALNRWHGGLCCHALYRAGRISCLGLVRGNHLQEHQVII